MRIVHPLGTLWSVSMQAPFFVVEKNFPSPDIMAAPVMLLSALENHHLPILICYRALARSNADPLCFYLPPALSTNACMHISHPAA